jgi:hypothetical protein
MSSSISVYAGKTALKEISKNGLSSQQIKVMAGASGGPKWFTLFGLDKYLFGEFFKDRQQVLHTIGSSAGSWRLACLAQKDPVAAISRLAHFYSNERYSKRASTNEISDKADILLKKVLAESGAKEIVENPIIQSHFIVARAKGLAASENRLVQLLGLITAAGFNATSANSLKLFFERFVFHSSLNKENPASHYFNYPDSNTQYVALDETNVHAVLMASGAIPLILRGIKEIPGAVSGAYRDGGIIDYHLDINFGEQGLILYPHFFPKIKPGWFDKSLSYRRAKLANFDRVVLITPSPEHVAQLPFGKISDRSDFTSLETEQRINYWQTVLKESERLADDFANLVEKDIGMQQVRPIEEMLVK